MSAALPGAPCGAPDRRPHSACRAIAGAIERAEAYSSRRLCCPGSAPLPPVTLGRLSPPTAFPSTWRSSPSSMIGRAALYHRCRTAVDWPDNDIRFARLSLGRGRSRGGTGRPELEAPTLSISTTGRPRLAAGYRRLERGGDTPTPADHSQPRLSGRCFRTRRSRRDRSEHSGQLAYRVDGVEFYGQAVLPERRGSSIADHPHDGERTYAREITTPQFGCGLRGPACRSGRAQGRLCRHPNGIDETWDPRSCPTWRRRSAPHHWKARRANANYVRGVFGLALSRGPLFGHRFAARAPEGRRPRDRGGRGNRRGGRPARRDGQGESRFERSHAGSPQTGSRRRSACAIGFDDAGRRRRHVRRQRLYLLMPSRIQQKPCGLSQMYAQRF